MECFRQIGRLVKSPFQRDPQPNRGLEIGPPTNFRKEEMPTFVADDDAQTLHSHGSTLEKDTMVSTLEREPSARQRIKNNVRRLSVRVARPLSEHE
ncbi:hypothetical protein BDV25DRAFT_108340 [Aspergillus avenaceus]|uniref:Uncharacterized protein n=1 Tax=Aspergillus avenaceus TaxID=36643 RepID=A0A5N6TWZ9_ASPAV|nr:hypothetical protein BDV25DRAFT_108340 [Aspergillus avenaceus]